MIRQEYAQPKGKPPGSVKAHGKGKMVIGGGDGLDLFTNDELLDKWMRAERNATLYLDRQRRIEWELKQRMEKNGAREIPHPELTCELKFPSPGYDFSKLYRLAELVPPEIFAKGFIPAHEETVMVPDKFNAVQFKTWAKYGTEVQEVIAEARIPGTPLLKIMRKPNPSASIEVGRSY